MFYMFMDFVIIILEVVCCQMFFDVFHYEGRSNKRLFTKKFTAVCIMVVSCYIIARIFNERILLKEIIVFFLIVVTMTFVRRIPWRKSVVLSLLFQGILVAMEYLALIFVKIMIPDVENMSSIEETLGRIIIIVDLLFCFMTVILIGRIFRGHKNKVMYSEEWIKYVLFPLITIVMISAILTVFKDETNERQLKVLCAVGLGLVVMNYLVFYLLNDVIRIEETVRERESFDIQGKNQLEMYSKLNENYELQKSDAHEFKNHLLCIQSLARDHKYEEMENYLHVITGEVMPGGIVIDTNNVIINTVFNTKYKEAVKKQIVMVFRVNDLSGVIIEDEDLVVLLSNLLNNAIEAVEKCQDDKVIRVKFTQEKAYVILSVKNKFSDPLIKVGDDFLTTKRHGRNVHGIGLKNTFKVIDKYNGIYDISTDNNEFFFSIIIPNCVL